MIFGPLLAFDLTPNRNLNMMIHGVLTRYKSNYRMWLILVYTISVRYVGTYCFLQNALKPLIVGIDG